MFATVIHRNRCPADKLATVVVHPCLDPIHVLSPTGRPPGTGNSFAADEPQSPDSSDYSTIQWMENNGVMSTKIFEAKHVAATVQATNDGWVSGIVGELHGNSQRHGIPLRRVISPGNFCLFELNIGKTFRQLGKGDLCLESRQWRSDAEVRTVAKGHVPVRRSRDVESIRIRELVGVAVGRAQEGHDSLIGFDQPAV